MKLRNYSPYIRGFNVVKTNHVLREMGLFTLNSLCVSNVHWTI